MSKSGIYDLNGKEICLGNWVRFYPSPTADDGCIWEGKIDFEDGVFTVELGSEKQIKNPLGWKQPHDWIKSRHWGATVGYPELGNWNCPRNPLTKIQNGFGREQADYEKYYKTLQERFGYGKRFINAKIIEDLNNDNKKNN